jgi:hypothetical protein
MADAVTGRTDIHVPMQQVPITFDAAISPPLRCIEFEAAGTVVLVDVSGAECTRTVVAGKCLLMQIQMVKSGGSLTAGQMFGSR